MDLGDLLKMDDALAKNKLYQKALDESKKNPAKVVIPLNVKSDNNDVGVPFKFGNNYQSEE